MICIYIEGEVLTRLQGPFIAKIEEETNNNIEAYGINLSSVTLLSLEIHFEPVIEKTKGL
ncbi:hypothetical protein [Niallia endozanthoxylica]|uniref:Uncharacterized protein n=1 Tax=Niallia endozanthoxylica TaxID=2036016 RepID=A0A5J5GZ82_9BACI|nr:hypothetical protein [Niallia endozanthoxylica]KAA9013590.1 hypothetical protein F4V44_24740 [Niallia endozanthoxylica]